MGRDDELFSSHPIGAILQVTPMTNTRISVIVPVYNEEGNITKLDREIKSAMSRVAGSFANSFANSSEIIYVNDGSSDGSLHELRGLKDVTIINLNRNYGQATALDAGFRACTGDIVVSLDGDGQNDPADISLLLEKFRVGNLDVVAGWRKDRKDSGGINMLTRVGRLCRRVLISDTVHDTGCTLRVYTKEATDCLDIGGEMHRYILAILKWKGFRIGEVVVNHRPRTRGKSNYNYTKAIRGFIDLVYIWFIQKYSQRPIHIFGYASIACIFLGFVIGFWTIYEKLFMGLGFNRNGLFFITAFLFLAGMIMFSFGIVIDILINVKFNSSKHEKRYRVREVVTK